MLNKELSARHFTTSAIHIIEQLWGRAADRGMVSELTEQTVTMLLLWSLLRWERKIALVALERIGVEPDALAKAVNQALSAVCEELRQHPGKPKFQDLPSGQKVIALDFHAPLEAFLEAAEHEALRMKHSWVGSEHLLLAAIQRACPRLREILKAHSVSYDGIKEQVIGLLKGRT
jgi:ATP-dependent Clp protease ATP-binding subunit ClpA